MDKEKIKSLILDRFNDANNFKTFYDRVWYACLCYVFGKQWIVWDDQVDSFVAQPAPTWKKDTRVVSNRVFPTVRNLIAKLVNKKIDITSYPTKQEDAIIACSNVANKLLKYCYSQNYINYDIAFDLLTYGKTFVKVMFDPNLGGEVTRTVDEYGNEETIKLGDIALSHNAPYEVWVDPLATTLKDARYCIICKLRSVDYVKEMYGVEVAPDTIPFPMMIQKIETFYGKKTNTAKNAVMVKEYWQKESKEYKNGLKVIMANNEVISVEENPCEDVNGRKYIPIAEGNFFVTNNQLYGTGLVDQIIPLQKEYNTLRSEIVMQEKLMTKPKWLVPSQSGITKNSITSEAGEKIYYDSRFNPPQPIPGTPPSAELWNHLAFIKQEFDDIAGIHDPSRGKVPSGVRSYQAIAYLQEQDDSLLSITYNNILQLYKDMSQMILFQAKQFFIEDRLLTITGKSDKFEVAEFKKGDLNRLGDVSLAIEEGTKLPHSVTAKQQFVMTLWQNKIISDPNKALKLLDFVTDDQLFGNDKMDELNAKTENDEMTQGTQSMVEDFDNHSLHVEIHNTFRKTPQYKELPDQIKKMFIQHVEMHQKLLDLMMMRMQEMQGGMIPPKK